MPKSKRDKKVSLTKTEKKRGLECKRSLVDRIRSSVERHDRVFVFGMENARNLHLQQIRREWKEEKGGSVFFLGKNRVMSLALGRNEGEEVGSGLHHVSELLREQRGLLFTNEAREDALKYFDDRQEEDYARSGAKAIETVILPAGPLPEFNFAVEPQLRSLGLPTALKKGIIHLTKEHIVCTKGEVLNSQQTRILKFLDKKQATFRIRLLAVWDKTLPSGEEFKLLEHKDSALNSEGEEEAMDQ